MVKPLLTVLVFCIAFITGLQAQDTRAFVEVNGLVVVEIESAPLAGSWIKETAVTGYTGECYYTWNKGTPSSTLPAGEGVLTYRIKITNAGMYYFRWHNYHNYPADQTLENDSWLKVDSGAWIKCYQNAGNAGYWNWVCKLEPSHGVFEDCNYNLSAGYHTIQISGRSYRHSIDRFHLSKDRTNLDKKLPESPREGDPIDTTNVTRILTPAAGTVLNMGQEYTFTGQGEGLSWAYDANSDGLGAIDMGTGESITYTIPTGINPPREFTVTLTGSNGTDVIVYTLGTAGILDGRGVVPDIGVRIRGTELIVTSGNGEALNVRVFHADGSPLTMGITRTGDIYSLDRVPAAGIYLWSVRQGDSAPLVRRFVVTE